METYANALLYAIPGFVILVLIEIMYGHYVKKQTHNVMDTVSSLSSGITNVIKDSLGLVVILISYPFLLKHLALIDLQSTWLVYVVAFIALDFAGYWNHRLSHKVNVFWNQHIIHHSSEEFNLACALRQPISNILGYFPLLLIPAALLGVPHQVIALLAPIHLFAQFWYHTKHIGKLGILEYVIVTPSQHRVHHAINPEYIDKNLGQIFCVWDRMFGTFQEELNEVPPVYGVLKPAQTWNPIHINFQHLWRLMKDAWRTKSWVDKLRIWFMPTGWRPKDVAVAFPQSSIQDVYNFRKYQTEATRSMAWYVVFQLLATTLLIMLMFHNFSNLGRQDLLFYGIFLLVSVYGFTSMMDKAWYAPIVEILRSLIGLSLIVYTGSWFGAAEVIPMGKELVMLYFVITFMATIYFARYEDKKSFSIN